MKDEFILVDDRGTEFRKPNRADYKDSMEYLNAYYAWSDAVRDVRDRRPA